MTAAPAPRPCESCPYRRDVPAGVWAAEEYEKLPPFDERTEKQPPAAFFCHRQDGRLCAGWVAVHDMGESLGLRLAAALEIVTPEEFEACLDYSTDIPLFASGAEAAEHGLARVAAPGPDAVRVIEKIARRR